jgi:hypothetical protein
MAEVQHASLQGSSPASPSRLSSRCRRLQSLDEICVCLCAFCGCAVGEQQASDLAGHIISQLFSLAGSMMIECSRNALLSSSRAHPYLAVDPPPYAQQMRADHKGSSNDQGERTAETVRRIKDLLWLDNSSVPEQVQDSTLSGFKNKVTWPR